MEWFYVYVLYSESDHQLYTGYTNNLRRRIEEHNKGKVISTKNRIPFILIYSEACLHQADAIAREKYLKTGMGKKFLKNRLKNYFENL
jgi:putative endonuclease